MLPYWPLYLSNEGFSAVQIGLITAVVMATKIFAPNFWGFLADKTGRRLRIIRLGAFLSVLFFLGVFLNPGIALMLLVMGLFSFFWNAILAQFEVVTLDKLGSQYALYSHIRLWGSIGFVLAVAALGFYFELFAIEHLPFFLLLILLGIWLSSLAVSGEKHHPHDEKHVSLAEIVRQPVVWSFLLGSFLLQVSHGPYYAFYSLYLERLGYGAALIGQLWTLGVVAEIVLFLFMHRIIERFSLRTIIQVSLAFTVLRWWMIASTENIYLLVFAQIFHAFSFGSFHAAAIELVRRVFPATAKGQGQALYSSVSFGAGGAAGALASGWIWNVSPQGCFYMAFASALLAWLITQCFLKASALSPEFESEEEKRGIREINL